MKKYVIVDIDGTISKVGDRIKYLKQDNPDWDKFYDSCFEDEPIEDVIELVKKLFLSYEVRFFTGRRNSVRDITMKWLLMNFPGYKISNYALFMRPNDDRRHDIEVKPELLKNAGIELNEIAFVLEDRNSMVKKWRDLGLTVLQVAEGDF